MAGADVHIGDFFVSEYDVFHCGSEKGCNSVA